MKKLLCLLCALLLLTSLLAGCTKTSTVSAPGAPGTPGAPGSTGTPDATQPVENPASTEPNPYADDPDGVHPMLFHVTGPDGQEMYLFGTIHVGDERTRDVLELAAPALCSCDALAVEFDIVAYESDMDAQMTDLMQFAYTDGSTVEDHMPAELYERAYALLQDAGLYPSMMRQFNLAMWSQLVDQAALLTTSDLDINAGMDRQLIDYAYSRGIQVRDVESAALQYGLLASFPDELNLLMIESTLDNLDTYAESTRELYEAWLKGDYGAILALVEDEETSEDDDYTPEQIAMVEDYNYKMLDERNLGMRDRAVQWMQAGDKVFFAVGAAHLVGDAGLVHLLRQEGYTVEQVRYPEGETLPEIDADPAPSEPGTTAPTGAVDADAVGFYRIESINGQSLMEMMLAEAANQGFSEEEFLDALEMAGMSVDSIAEMFSLELSEDGTCVLTIYGEAYDGTWSVSGSDVTVTILGSPLTGTLEDGRITLYEGSDEMVFVK